MTKLSLCFTLLVILGRETACAQDEHVVDSLKNLLEYKTGPDRFPPLYELTFEYIDRDNEKALEIIVQAEEAALFSVDWEE